MSKSTRPAPDTSKTTSIQLRDKITALLHDSGKSLADLVGSTPYTLQGLQQLLDEPDRITVTDLCCFADALSVKVSTLLEPAEDKPREVFIHWFPVHDLATEFARAACGLSKPPSKRWVELGHEQPGPKNERIVWCPECLLAKIDSEKTQQ